jgi:hypothetical protein
MSDFFILGGSPEKLTLGRFASYFSLLTSSGTPKLLSWAEISSEGCKM